MSNSVRIISSEMENILTVVGMAGNGLAPVVAQSYDSSHHSLYFVRLHVGVNSKEHRVARAQDISKAAQELRGFLTWEVAWPWRVSILLVLLQRLRCFRERERETGREIGLHSAHQCLSRDGGCSWADR